MKIIAVTQARIGSTRFPEKILKRIQDKSLLQIHLERIKKSKLLDETIVATTNEKGVDQIIDMTKNIGASFFQGNLHDVLDRFYQAVKHKKPDYIVRLTSDCPLIDSQLIDNVIEYTLDNQLDYCSNTLEERFPDGQDIEVFTYEALKLAWKDSKLQSDREHVTPYIYQNSTYLGGKLFKSDNFNLEENFNEVRLTVDEPKDFEVISKLIEKLGFDKDWLSYTRYYLENSEINSLNSETIRNEGYLKSLRND